MRKPLTFAGLTGVDPADQAPPGPADWSAIGHLAPVEHTLRFRVRYSETDQMGAVYNSRPLEWFECGRSELLRHLELPYAVMEERGLFLPVIEAHLEWFGRARYDDLLEMTTRLSFPGRARVRCDNEVRHAERGRDVVRGWTLHAFANAEGRPGRPPAWFTAALTKLGVVGPGIGGTDPVKTG